MFVGQWPPTFLATALFFRLLHPSREPGEISGMKRAMDETQRKAGEYTSEMGGTGTSFSKP